jgi:hypothetical protein
MYGTAVLKKVKKYSILGFSVAGGNTVLPIWPVRAHSDPVDTDVA